MSSQGGDSLYVAMKNRGKVAGANNQRANMDEDDDQSVGNYNYYKDQKDDEGSFRFDSSYKARGFLGK